jgi:UDP-glucuronate 4-epimerase
MTQLSGFLFPGRDGLATMLLPFSPFVFFPKTLMINPMKRVFITGAAGFIGFHVAQFLHRRGDAVVGYDNFNDYYPVSLKRARAEELRKMGISVIEGDICDAAALNRQLDAHQTTHLLHLAAQAGVRYSIINPAAYIEANITGFLNILEYCRHHPHVPLIYASSSSVYGLNTKIPFAVKDPTDHQASLYGATKKSNELMAHTYHHLYGIPVTGLRFFTVYGPWGRPDMAYYSFTKAILETRPIDVFNEGNLQRDFTYIDDIVAGTVAAMDLAAPYELFNLGNNQPVTLLSFIETIERALNKKAQKNFLPMQAGDVLATYADITHSQQKLGFQPKTSIETGIQHFVQWYQANGHHQ